MTTQHVLLLVGSPRGKSTSKSLGSYLLDRLHERGWETETLRINPALRSTERWEALVESVNRADLVVLSFPLYVDNLPAAVIKALELIAQQRRTLEQPKTQRFLAISNSGFPEARQNETALAICRRFAQETGFTWAGGLALGGGPSIDGKPLHQAGGMVRNVTKALDLAADALADGQAVPQEAISLMAKPLIPAWAYRLMGGLGWRQQAKRFGAQKRLSERPYQPE